VWLAYEFGVKFSKGYVEEKEIGAIKWGKTPKKDWKNNFLGKYANIVVGRNYLSLILMDTFDDLTVSNSHLNRLCLLLGPSFSKGRGPFLAISPIAKHEADINKVAW
jgi:hypothetical protein